MKRICHMTSAHKSNDIRIFEKECSSLAKNADYEVWLVAQGDSRSQNNVNVLGLGQIPSGRLGRILSFSRKVYKAAKDLDADIYHFHDPELIPYGLNLKVRGKKVIFDSHENYTYQILTKDYLPYWVRRFVSGSYNMFETFAAKRFDAVIFPCRMKGEHPFKGRSKRCVFINNAPIFEEKPISKKTGDSEEFKTCYVGGLTEARGITKSVLASAKANVKLVLAGSFDNKEYEERLNNLPEYASVDYRGQCSHEEVYDILAECDAGLSVLQNVGQYLIIETLPTKVYEYMQMKMPVILGASPYAKELNDKYDFAELVDPENEDDIADAIIRLKADRAKCRKKGLNGFELVKNHLNWAAEERELFSLYRELLGE